MMTPSIIILPDGYNGHTEMFYSVPIERTGDVVKLSCARPGKEYMVRWICVQQLEKFTYNKQVTGE